jgi:pyruvate/2-oxoglutarate dehydrogenase complex dihydrolipoamide dehydrogenase (E3) component
MFEQMSHAAAKGGHVGISLSEPPKLDLAATVKWKEGIVDRLNSGVAGLLKRAKVRVVSGWANFSDAKTCTVGRYHDRGGACHPRHRLRSGGTSESEVRRRCHLLDRSA